MSGPISLDDTKNWQVFRSALNAALAAAAPGYANPLPSAGTQPNGKLYVLTSTQKLYQNQNGAWVLLT